jgi:hypothetical protein
MNPPDHGCVEHVLVDEERAEGVIVMGEVTHRRQV